MGFREWIVPQEKKFFDFFEQEARILVRGAKALKSFSKEFDKKEYYMKKIHKIENEGDEIVHTIYNELNKTFITPIDREDINSLASKLDDVIDYIDAVVKRIYTYDLKDKPCHFDKYTELIYHGTVDIEKAIRGLRDLKDPNAIKHACIHVNKLENDGDALLTECLRDLFKSDDTKEIIMLKEVYDFMEMTTDRLEEAAFLIMDILVKNT
jgi:uncharacterized protein Yka (UPF0111/DUF47 family)